MSKAIAVISSVLYISAIILANWLVSRYGLIPVGFGLLAPAGVYAAAVTFPLRDIIQRSAGRIAGIACIIIGAGISYLISPTLAIASGVTFLISETADFAVYTPLQRRWFVPAVLASGIASAVIDSLLFLRLAHIPYSVALEGQIVGKLWVVILLGGPLAILLRKRLPLSAAVTVS